MKEITAAADHRSQSTEATVPVTRHTLVRHPLASRLRLPSPLASATPSATPSATLLEAASAVLGKEGTSPNSSGGSGLRYPLDLLDPLLVKSRSSQDTSFQDLSPPPLLSLNHRGRSCTIGGGSSGGSRGGARQVMSPHASQSEFLFLARWVGGCKRADHHHHIAL